MNRGGVLECGIRFLPLSSIITKLRAVKTRNFVVSVDHLLTMGTTLMYYLRLYSEDFNYPFI